MRDILPEPVRVRASTVDGIFYPAEQPELSSLVRDLLERCEVPAGEACSIISPHAAYQYSGVVSAAAFKAASCRSVNRVVLIGPVHREPVEGLILPESQAFQTPLGACRVGETLLRELAARSPGFVFDDIPHLEEHCLEVQLPFLQQLFPQAEIVPVLMGQASPALIQTLSDAFLQVFENLLDSTLFVVSANMTSYTSREQGEAELAAVLGLIRQGDWQVLVDGTSKRSISSCGAGCIAAILSLQQHLGGKSEILKLASSLAVNGDQKKVVHYAAVAFERASHGADPVNRGEKTTTKDGPGGD